jgi:hypothetical protein
MGIQAQTFQSPFKLSLGIDLPISLNAVGLGAGSFILGLDKKPPTEQSILKLNRSEVNRFDRGATYQYSKVAGYSSDACMYLSMGLPLLHLANKNSRKDFGKITLMYAEVFVLNTAITNLLKETVARKRPLLYNPDVPMASKLKKDNLKSFFSGHTSTTASMSYFFAYTFHMYNPGSKWRPVVWSLSAALPIVTGLLRYKAGKHYWTDIITGYVVGAIIGVGVPWLHSTALKVNRR